MKKGLKQPFLHEMRINVERFLFSFFLFVLANKAHKLSSVPELLEMLKISEFGKKGGKAKERGRKKEER